jgi:recombinational DNA repair protein (RecF pathway)
VIATDRGLVLRTYPLRETSQIVSVLGREHGRLRLVANGSRGGRNRFGASLEVGNEVEVVFSLVAGRDLGTVREAVLRHAWVAGTPRLDVLATGLAVVELVDRVVPEGAHDVAVLDAALAALAAQGASADRAEAILGFLRFELELLGALGVQPAVGVGLGLGPQAAAAATELEAGRLPRATSADVRRRIGLALHRLLTAHVDRYRYPRALALLKKVDSSPSGGVESASSADDLETA